VCSLLSPPGNYTPPHSFRILRKITVSRQQKQDEIREILINNKVEVVPEDFLCRGMFFGLGYLKKEDIDAAVAFAQRPVSENS
jgi:hypothetical protein